MSRCSERFSWHRNNVLNVDLKESKLSLTDAVVNPLRTNSDLSQTSHCNMKGVSVSEVMRIENMITQVQFY